MKSKWLTMPEITIKALAAGFRPELVPMIVSVVWAESGGNAYAININDTYPTSKTYLSMDVGLCQFNTFWNIDAVSPPVIRVSEMLNPDRALRVMSEITAGGTRNMSLWSAYVYNRWQRFLPYAEEVYVSVTDTL